ncbi:MAG: poly(A) polymerase [Pseudobdellovibrionaceae bacterium]|jgi:poly(A) polymerase
MNFNQIMDIAVFFRISKTNCGLSIKIELMYCVTEMKSTPTNPSKLINKKYIDPRALDIVERLKKNGFESYLVGGCVRDLLVQVVPKDFDIVTNAQPQQIKKIIPFCFIIGRRFKLVLAKRGEQQFEVATFRRQLNDEELLDAKNAVEVGDEVIISDNMFGTSEEDARRRDFTINALFYDPTSNEIKDFVSGLDDIATRTIRMIGKPYDRLVEDPIRILRALRLSHKLSFQIEPELRQQMKVTADTLKQTILPRKREEYLKILRLKDPCLAFVEMYDLQILQATLPSLGLLVEDTEKWTDFQSMMAKSRLVGFDQNSPLETTLVFLYCFFRAKYGELRFEQLVEEIQSDENQNFMKDELGVFKSEALLFIQCLENYFAFEDWDKYQRKGERRKAAFINQDYIPLAYRLMLLDDSLSAESNLFWWRELTTKHILSI